MRSPRPAVVAHADWSTDPRKRWLCLARRGSSGYRVSAPEPVGDARTLGSRLTALADGKAVLLGVDFPLGLPATYARRLGLESFVEFLGRLGDPEWADFFAICDKAEQISLYRPFYPRVPGGSSHAELCRGLGVHDIDELRRRCERRTENRRAASPLFWTLGSQQVGRAAIAGWRDLLLSEQPAFRLWPFEGGLAELLSAGGVVLAETYPAESAIHVGLAAPGRGWSKRRQSDRAIHADAINRWAIRRRIRIGEELQPLLRDGFGDLRTGEDRFDALLGVAGMLEVVLGGRPEMPPLSNERRLIEGWILGQR